MDITREKFEVDDDKVLDDVDLMKMHYNDYIRESNKDMISNNNRSIWIKYMTLLRNVIIERNYRNRDIEMIQRSFNGFFSSEWISVSAASLSDICKNRKEKFPINLSRIRLV